MKIRIYEIRENFNYAKAMINDIRWETFASPADARESAINIHDLISLPAFASSKTIIRALSIF